MISCSWFLFFDRPLQGRRVNWSSDDIGVAVIRRGSVSFFICIIMMSGGELFPDTENNHQSVALEESS